MLNQIDTNAFSNKGLNGLLCLFSMVLLSGCSPKEQRSENNPTIDSLNSVVDSLHKIIRTHEDIIYASQKIQEQNAAENIVKEETTSELGLIDVQEEFDKLRNNEEAYIGTTVTIDKLLLYAAEDDLCEFYADYNRQVKLFISPSIHIPKLHDNDWLTVTGIFKGVNTQGQLKIDVTKIINTGVH